MSDDCISRQAVLEIQAKYAEHIGATKFWQMRDDIKALPPVTPQPKTGSWIDNNNSTISCNYCHTWFNKDNRYSYMHYCPNCGAKMAEGSDEE